MVTHIDEKEFFQNVTIRICGTLDITKGFKKCFKYLRDFFPMDELSLYWYDGKEGKLRVVAETDTSESGISQKVYKQPEIAIKYHEKEDTRPQTEFFNNFDEHVLSKYIEKISGKTGRSLLITRLIKDGQHIGGVAASTFGMKRPYSEDHVKLFSLVHDPFVLALANFKKHEEILQLKNSLSEQRSFLIKELKKKNSEEVIGLSSGLSKVMDLVKRVASVETPVLVLGETGVGKEVIANSIHSYSGRKDNPLVKVNCGAIPENLVDSELFGHEKGAFTGAVNKKIGRFERANNGTIFLDEIGELPIQAQVKLLRVLQNHEIERVGGTKTIPINVRVIAATHRDLQEMVKSGKFREDLWFRINGFPITIPPLRERVTDIPQLIKHFIGEKCKELKISGRPEPGAKEIEKMMKYHWKGNVRELQNTIERALIRYDKGPLCFDLPKKGKEINQNKVGLKTLDSVIVSHISKVLKTTNGKINGPGGAAEKLNINPNTLRNKMKKLGISNVK